MGQVTFRRQGARRALDRGEGSAPARHVEVLGAGDCRQQRAHNAGGLGSALARDGGDQLAAVEDPQPLDWRHLHDGFDERRDLGAVGSIGPRRTGARGAPGPRRRAGHRRRDRSHSLLDCCPHAGSHRLGRHFPNGSKRDCGLQRRPQRSDLIGAQLGSRADHPAAVDHGFDRGPARVAGDVIGDRPQRDQRRRFLCLQVMTPGHDLHERSRRLMVEMPAPSEQIALVACQPLHRVEVSQRGRIERVKSCDRNQRHKGRVVRRELQRRQVVPHHQRRQRLPRGHDLVIALLV